jgi:ribose transport system substrate-binding protein
MFRVTAAASVLVVAIGACGASDDKPQTAGGGGASTGALVAEAKASVTAGAKPVTKLELPSEAPTPARDKRVVAVTCTNEGDGCPISAQAVGEATRQFGWRVQVIDGKGDPGVWNSAILNAISTKADAIVLSAVAPGLVKDALAKAEAAGIPVVSMFEPRDPDDGLYGHVTPDHSAQGTLAADWVIADSDAKATVIAVTDDEFVELGHRHSAFTGRLDDCAGCEVVATVPSTLATLSTRLPGAVASALQQHPDATYVVTPTDNHALFASQGIQQAGRAGAVKLVGFDGNTPSYTLVRNGTQAIDIVESYTLQGWLAADLLIRAFAGEPGSDHVLPSRLFTRETMPETLWQTEVDFKAQLTKLWTGG